MPRLLHVDELSDVAGAGAGAGAGGAGSGGEGGGGGGGNGFPPTYWTALRIFGSSILVTALRRFSKRRLIPARCIQGCQTVRLRSNAASRTRLPRSLSILPGS